MCAVSYDDVREIAQQLDPQPQVISLDPHTLGEVLGDARKLAEATDQRDAAVDLVRDTSDRIDRVRVAVRKARAAPAWQRWSGWIRRSRRATGPRS